MTYRPDPINIYPRIEPNKSHSDWLGSVLLDNQADFGSKNRELIKIKSVTLIVFEPVTDPTRPDPTYIHPYFT